MDGRDLLGLAELIKPKDEENDKEELDVGGHKPFSANPGAIGPKAGAASSQTKNPPATKDIWSTEEVSEQQQYEYDDPREQPEYEMVYKQAVRTEDVFLGMGGKTPTTASCEDLVVKIKLPGVDFKDVDLDVTETFLDCRTSKYRLGLHLPHKVENKLSKAKWISDLSLLEITLRLNRTYDYLNK